MPVPTRVREQSNCHGRARRLRCACSGFLLFILVVGTCRADTIRFGSNESVSGHIVSVHKGIVSFRSDHLGMLTFHTGPDVTITVDGLVTITSEDGKEYVGLIRPNTGPLWTLLIDGGVQEASLSPEKIMSFRLTPAAEFSNRGILPTETRENPWEGVAAKPGLTGPWSVDSTFSFTGVQATRNSRLINWNGRLENSTGKGDLTFTADRIYNVSGNTITGKHFVNDDETQAEAIYTKKLSPRSSLYLDFQGLSDETNFVDYRLMASGGVRYKLVRSDSVKFTLFGGPSWLDYEFLPNDGVIAPAAQFGAAQFGYTSEYDLPANTTIRQDFSFNQGLESGHSFETTALFNIRHMVTSWFYLDARVFEDYDSRTAYQSEHNRLRYFGGLGVKLSAF
jgi:hypothetical protein